MIYLFHGENQPAVRDALNALKKEYGEAIFWGGDLSAPGGLEELRAYLFSPSFFSKKELVIIEFLKGGVPKGFWDSAAGGEKDIALVFPNKIPANQIPKANAFGVNADYPRSRDLPAGRQGLRVRYFREEVPKSVFPLLDAIAAKNKKLAFSHAQRLLKAGEDPQFILAMIVWQMRNLAKVKGGAVKGLHPYVLGKLERAAGRFSEEELARVFVLLLKEDLGSKKGKANSATLGFLIDKLTS